jgi:hypothetical protein
MLRELASSRLIGVLLPMVAGAFPVLAQPACPECRIELELLQRVGSLEADPAARYHASRVSWMADGHFVIAAPATQGPEVATYRTDGSFVAHRMKRGEGPGEFKDRIVESSVVGGSIVVLEGQGRVHTFLPDLSLISTQNLPISPYTSTVLANGSIVAHVPLAREDGQRYMQHLLRPSGQGPFDIVRSFGVASDPLEELRVAYATTDGGFWVRFPGLPGRFERYSGEGELLREISVPRGEEEGSSIAVLELPDGRIVLRTLLREPGQGGLADTLLELVDPESGAVLTSRRLPRSYQFVRNSQEFLASTEETESGDVEFLIWRLRIEGGPGG